MTHEHRLEIIDGGIRLSDSQQLLDWVY